MNATIGDALILGIEKLSDVVSKTAPEIWRIYIKQIYINAYISIIGAIVCLIVGLITYKYSKKIDWKNEDDKFYYKDNAQMAKIALIAVSIVFFIISLGIFLGSIGHLLNPEYQAIQILMRQLVP